MTKRNIVQSIADELGHTQAETKDIVQRTLDAIIHVPVSEGRVELRKFGLFEMKRRKVRRARNPRTGERVDVPERYAITFRTGRTVEERVAE